MSIEKGRAVCRWVKLWDSEPWNLKMALAVLFYGAGFEPQPSHVFSRHSTSELHPSHNSWLHSKDLKDIERYLISCLGEQVRVRASQERGVEAAAAMATGGFCQPFPARSPSLSPHPKCWGSKRPGPLLPVEQRLVIWTVSG